MESAAMEQTAPTLLDRLLRELGLVGNVRHNVEEAADALTVLQASMDDLRDAIQRSPQQVRPEQVGNWFKSVDEAAEKIAEVKLDYDKRCLCAASCSPNIFSSYAISRRAVHMLERVKALRTEYDMVKKLTGDNPPASCIQKPVADVFVGKSPAILAQLLSYLDDDKEARIISICGMAGIGKSELMRRLNNEFLPAPGAGAESSRAGVFQFVVWVDNASSDVTVIQDEIAKRLKLGDLGPADRDAEARAGPIFSLLKDASFLVLLDNLMASVSLADMGIPNPVHRRVARKQKVVLTTRFEFVSVCGPTDSCFRRIDVECLDWDASWELFKESVGQEMMVEGREMVRLRERVARECGGLPIALEKIGRAMSSTKVRQPGDWRRTAEFLKSSRIHQIPGMETENTELLRDLKKSYDHGVGSNSHRECFLCCALWPRGGSIHKAELVDCWIGLGLIREPSHDDSVQNGHSIISTLQEANLLLPGDGENAERQVKLQEVVRDMALWIARDCGREESKWVVQAGVSLNAFEVVDLCEAAAAAERVSLMHSSIQELPQSDHWTSAGPGPGRLALLMLQHNHSLTKISGAFLGSASAALAYLDLSHTAVEELPDELGALAMLQYLNLSFTPLKTLPGCLANLGRLKHLFLKHTSHLSAIPAGVFRGLTSVRVIDMYPSRYMDWEEGASISAFEFEHIMVMDAFIQSLGITTNPIVTVQRLGRLMNVCTRRLLMTRFHSPSSVTLCPSHFKDLMGSFSLLETLLELSITECDTLEQLVLDGEEEDKDESNESWCLSNLEHLELCGLPNLTGIIWKRMSVSFFLGALISVKIENCSRLTNVAWVIQVPCLQHLELRDCATMESVVDAGQELPPIFPSLMTLVLVNLPVLRIVSTQQVGFPRLEAIHVGCCDNLRRIHIKPERMLRIQGTMDWWRGLECEWDVDNNVEFMETIVV